MQRKLMARTWEVLASREHHSAHRRALIHVVMCGTHCWCRWRANILRGGLSLFMFFGHYALFLSSSSSCFSDRHMVFKASYNGQKRPGKLFHCPPHLTAACKSLHSKTSLIRPELTLEGLGVRIHGLHMFLSPATGNSRLFLSRCGSPSTAQCHVQA